MRMDTDGADGADGADADAVKKSVSTHTQTHTERDE